MKKYLVLLVFALFFPLTPVLALGEFDPGGVYNPIHIQVEPTDQQRNKNLQSSLQSQYGGSEYRSCRAKVSACNGDMSDPSSEYGCLLAVQYAFDTPLCRVHAPLQCDTGYTMVNGSCVRNAVQTPSFCPGGTTALGGACVPFTCSGGYVPQGSKCVKVQKITASASPSSQTIEQPETFGGAGSSGNGPGLESCDRLVLGQTTHFGMLTSNECYAVWQSAVEEAISDTRQNAQPMVTAKASQAATVAIADSVESVPVETKPEPRRGFWSWLLGLFGF